MDGSTKIRSIIKQTIDKITTQATKKLIKLTPFLTYIFKLLINFRFLFIFVCVTKQPESLFTPNLSVYGRSMRALLLSWPHCLWKETRNDLHQDYSRYALTLNIDPGSFRFPATLHSHVQCTLCTHTISCSSTDQYGAVVLSTLCKTTSRLFF